MKPLLAVLLLTGCTTVSQLTKEQVDEFCSHSKEHRDIVMLGVTDDLFEPHSVHVHCGCEYGFEFDHKKEECFR